MTFRVKHALAASGAKSLGTPKRDGRTPAHAAAENSHAECLAILAEARPESLAALDERGKTPVHIAAQTGQAECLTVIAAARPELLGVPRDEGRTPAFLSAQTGHVDCLEVIAECCPDSLSATTPDGRTPLFAAADHGHADCVAFLLEAAPDTVAIPGRDGVTPSEVAAKAGHGECARLISDREPPREPKRGLGEWLSSAFRRSKQPSKGTSASVGRGSPAPDTATRDRAYMTVCRRFRIDKQDYEGQVVVSGGGFYLTGQPPSASVASVLTPSGRAELPAECSVGDLPSAVTRSPDWPIKRSTTPVIFLDEAEIESVRVSWLTGVQIKARGWTVGLYVGPIQTGKLRRFMREEGWDV